MWQNASAQGWVQDEGQQHGLTATSSRTGVLQHSSQASADLEFFEEKRARAELEDVGHLLLRLLDHHLRCKCDITQQ